MDQSIEHVCVPAAVGDGHVEIRTLGILMAALVMLNVLDFGNCGHIVTMATRGQIDGGKSSLQLSDHQQCAA
jgi:hypothetical protein